MENSIKHLGFIIEQFEKINAHFRGRNLTNIQFFAITMFERLAKVSKGLRTLLNNVENENDLEFSCGIILRSSILDMLIVKNVYKIIIEGEGSAKNENEIQQDVQDFCNKVIADGLDNTIKYIKVAKDVGIIDQQKMIDAYTIFVNKYKDYFEPYLFDGSLPKCKYEFIAPEKLFKGLANNSEMKKLSQIYDAYLLFSKYDHYGVLYYEASRMPIEKKLFRIKSTIELMVFTKSILHYLLRLFSNDDHFLNEESKTSSKYLHDNIVIRQN